jgi:hypothetical protein
MNDDTCQDLTPKEIMRRWETSGKVPQATIASSSPQAQSGGSKSRGDQRNNPHITQVDNAWQGETSVRHVGGGNNNYGTASAHTSPPQNYDLGTPNLPYSQAPPGSTESHRNGSPHRHSYRSPAFQKQTQLGTAGAG